MWCLSPLFLPYFALLEVPCFGFLKLKRYLYCVKLNYLFINQNTAYEEKFHQYGCYVCSGQHVLLVPDKHQGGQLQCDSCTPGDYPRSGGWFRSYRRYQDFLSRRQCQDAEECRVPGRVPEGADRQGSCAPGRYRRCWSAAAGCS